MAAPATAAAVMSLVRRLDIWSSLVVGKCNGAHGARAACGEDLNVPHTWHTSGTLTLRRMRVLVVEDERELAGLLVRGLDEAGFRVDTALDGPTAIRKASE